MYALLDQAREPLIATPSEALIAREALPRLRPVADAGCDVRVRVLGTADIVVPLPAAAVKVIVDVLAAMADSKPISVIPTDAELTTQQAADMLNVSRPHLVKLLNADEIPFSKVGTHRRVRVADLLAYKTRSIAIVGQPSTRWWPCLRISGSTNSVISTFTVTPKHPRCLIPCGSA